MSETRSDVATPVTQPMTMFRVSCFLSSARRHSA